MSLVRVCLIIIVVGVLLWAVNTYVPMQPPVKNLLNGVVVIALLLWLLTIFVPGFHDIRIR